MKQSLICQQAPFGNTIVWEPLQELSATVWSKLTPLTAPRFFFLLLQKMQSQNISDICALDPFSGSFAMGATCGSGSFAIGATCGGIFQASW